MAGHSVKLSSFMINRKIPRAWRDRVPLLVDGSEIAWVCGYRIAENLAVGPHTQQVIKFQFMLLD